MAHRHFHPTFACDASTNYTDGRYNSNRKIPVSNSYTYCQSRVHWPRSTDTPIQISPTGSLLGAVVELIPRWSDQADMLVLLLQHIDSLLLLLRANPKKRRSRLRQIRPVLSPIPAHFIPLNSAAHAHSLPAALDQAAPRHLHRFGVRYWFQAAIIGTLSITGCTPPPPSSVAVLLMIHPERAASPSDPPSPSFHICLFLPFSPSKTKTGEERGAPLDDPGPDAEG